MFLLQYGKGVVVEGVDGNQIARLYDYPTAYVYYFDETGRPIEIPVDRATQTQATPALPVEFSAPIRLEGYGLPRSKVKRGEALPVLLYWRATAKGAVDYSVFVHLINERGEIVAQEDAPPRGGTAPTSGWAAGQLIVDAPVITIPSDATRGEGYRLEVGLYLPATLERSDISGTPGADNSIVIQTFAITE